MFIQLTNHQYLQPNQRSLYIEEECYLESMTLTSDLVMRFRSRYVNLHEIMLTSQRFIEAPVTKTGQVGLHAL
jgi:hypothetical protein